MPLKTTAIDMNALLDAWEAEREALRARPRSTTHTVDFSSGVERPVDGGLGARSSVRGSLARAASMRVAPSRCLSLRSAARPRWCVRRRRLVLVMSLLFLLRILRLLAWSGSRTAAWARGPRCAVRGARAGSLRAGPSRCPSLLILRRSLPLVLAVVMRLSRWASGTGRCALSATVTLLPRRRRPPCLSLLMAFPFRAIGLVLAGTATSLCLGSGLAWSPLGRAWRSWTEPRPSSPGLFAWSLC
jgi:hypothetical protein